LEALTQNLTTVMQQLIYWRDVLGDNFSRHVFNISLSQKKVDLL